ncbi:lipoate--protein ligase family protein [Paraliobacillus sediminis]|uniref:lipoate--protein ligase family protein n=1 Tax=Paraliobacillus sediminis TaxID=1885916 RepID=UPI000E3CF006|nr:biotin/lipoate A/B protein ligase family protein [Paraliobacillus sediminis]
MKETWYFIDSGHCTPAYNMALDEVLLNWHSQNKIPPVLRFYGWKPAGLSVGYFQKVNGKIDIDQAADYGIELVRRLTGGRAVLHDQELTYSVLVSEQNKNMPSSVKDSCHAISMGVLEGFKELNIEATFSIPKSTLKTTNSSVCFEEPSWYELIIDGKKAVGSAQTRKKGVILQHGSIPLKVDKVKLFDLFLYSSDRLKTRARQTFGDKAVTLNDVTDQMISFDDAKIAFKKGFERGLGIILEPFQLSEELINEVNDIAVNKYSNNEWNYSR